MTSPPPMISNKIRRVIKESNLVPCSLEPSVLFSLINNKDEKLLSDFDFFIKKYNSVLNVMTEVNHYHLLFNERGIGENVIIPSGNVDHAEIKFSSDDAEIMADITVLENLYRDLFRGLIPLLDNAEKLIFRINTVSKYLFKDKGWRLEKKGNIVVKEYLRDMPFFGINDLSG